MGSMAETHSAADAFFEAIAQAGITHCFVNLGSDHPGMIEAMVKGQRRSLGKFPRIITCPHEMVAMSMADGYARVTGKPQCVIVHVDVGTQGLGVAVHNASVGRAPILVFAGLSPFTLEGELRGSRSEFIHWLQDVPDQRAIVSQYCRYSAELKTGCNVKQMVNRALQFATSEPQGPAYLCAAREVIEAEVPRVELEQRFWAPIGMGGLPPGAAAVIAEALASAEKPLVVTTYSGRNLEVPAALVELADTVKTLRVLDATASDMCFPADHPAWVGTTFGSHDAVTEADIILVLNCDVPWIPTRCKPREDTRIFHIDIDPLKQQMPLFYLPSEARYRADTLLSVRQIIEELRGPASSALSARDLAVDEESRRTGYEARVRAIDERAVPSPDGSFGTGHLSSVLRSVCPSDTIWTVEAVTNTSFILDNIRPTLPGQWINSGGGGLGWSGGATLGVKMATDVQAGGGSGSGRFVCQIVGDGTYLFGVPASVYWISRRYNIPVLTVVLNNNGWNAPRHSYNFVHPDGEASRVDNVEMNISFAPGPDYGGIAAAAGAGDIHALKVSHASELESVLKDAVAKVLAGKTAVVDCSVVPGS